MGIKLNTAQFQHAANRQRSGSKGTIAISLTLTKTTVHSGTCMCRGGSLIHRLNKAAETMGESDGPKIAYFCSRDAKTVRAAS